ncbi:MAG: 50S ribosomal protein L19 [Candidatus Gygaella obscura]|nr:50S ribosomal protein L19 [Candidatus Gygaella obscura]
MPEFGIGDEVKVFVKIPEGDKTRLHPFEGTVIARKGSGINEIFTVRKISFGEGIERVFPIHSPSVDSIKVLHKAIKVRRAKLYYLRYKKGKKAKIKQH